MLTWFVRYTWACVLSPLKRECLSLLYKQQNEFNGISVEIRDLSGTRSQWTILGPLEGDLIYVHYQHYVTAHTIQFAYITLRVVMEAGSSPYLNAARCVPNNGLGKSLLATVDLVQSPLSLLASLEEQAIFSPGIFMCVFPH